MNRLLATAGLIAITTSSSFAGGLDRTGQPIGIIFEEGNYAEFTFGGTMPNVSGTDTLGNPTGSVADAFMSIGGGLKLDLTDALSVSVIAERPFGSDVVYSGSPAATMLGGTTAIATSTSLTAVGRYKFSDRFSVHAGVRHQSIRGDITLSGLAFGALNGYNVALASGTGTGFVVGGAFEIPSIKARVALTYNSEISHSLPTTETVGGVPAFGASANTEVKSPSSINLDVQSGINPKTLLFGSVRYAKWSDLNISPSGFDASVNPGSAGDSLVALDDSIAYSIGIGRALTDKLSASVTVGYEAPGSDNLVSPLAPTDGNWSVGVGARYRADNVTVSGGVRYTKFGDAQPETGTPDTARASVTGSDAISVGLKIGIHF